MAYEKGTNRPATNTELINNYGDLAGSEVQALIKQTLDTEGYAGFQSVDIEVMNKWLDGVTNKLFEQRIYDPLDFKNVYERFVVRGNEPFGSEIEGLSTDLPSVEDYSLKSSLLENKKVKTYVNKIYERDQKKVEVSYPTSVMRKAFTTEGGVFQLIRSVIKKIEDTIDIYLYKNITTDLKGITRVHQMPNKAATEEESKIFMKDLIKFAKDLKFPSNKWNELGLASDEAVQALSIPNVTTVDQADAAGVGHLANLNKGILVLNHDVVANLNVDFYVTFFNSTREELSNYFEDVIEIKDTTDPNTIGYILDPDAYTCKFTLEESGAFYDPTNRMTKVVKHFDITRGLTQHVTAVKLTVA